MENGLFNDTQMTKNVVKNKNEEKSKKNSKIHSSKRTKYSPKSTENCYYKEFFP